jgi:L,D-transpeptidase catalytic domain
VERSLHFLRAEAGENAMQKRLNQLKVGEKQAVKTLAIMFLLALSVRNLKGQTASGAAHETNQRKVVVSVAHRKLALVENGRVKKVYPIAVGAAGSPSPSGNFEIKNRLVQPTYYHPGKVIPAGADNPLGTRWIGLSAKGYGIHGTNLENSIGKAASHGCIRMHRQDLEELFADVQVGDEVEIHASADSELESIFGDVPSERESDELVSALIVGEPAQQ